MTGPSSATRLLALLGNPVSHSLSPAFQNAALQAANLDAVYLALRCAQKELPGLLRGISLAGGGGNVTIPHKEAAALLLDRPSDAVLRTGACNTFWGEDDLVCGDNTDVIGFSRAVEDLLGRSPAGSRVLLLGAGGSARAAVLALTLEGADEIMILNRSSHRIEELRARFGGAPTRLSACTAVTALEGDTFDLVVNATPIGLNAEDPLPLPAEVNVRFGAVLDLVYARGSTRWVREQAARGVVARDGREMLLHQGAAAFERWWGSKPPLQIMRDALYRNDRLDP